MTEKPGRKDIFLRFFRAWETTRRERRRKPSRMTDIIGQLENSECELLIAGESLSSDRIAVISSKTGCGTDEILNAFSIFVHWWNERIVEAP